jgi:hypothetical protein
VAVALASDNTRDQFYAYGDLDMLEVFAQVGVCNAAAVNTRSSAVTSAPLHLVPSTSQEHANREGLL